MIEVEVGLWTDENKCDEPGRSYGDFSWKFFVG